MRALVAIAALALAVVPSASLAEDQVEEAADPHPEAALYDPELDATAAVDAALARAELRGTYVMVVLGANWCHDSRALAGWLQSERFAALVGDWYEVVYVDVGHPQDGNGRNLDIAARFGLEGITNTPTMLLIDNEGNLQNAATAKSWRNAASRSGDEIYDELKAFPFRGS